MIVTGTTSHVDLPTLRAWMVSARPGASLTYAVGDVANDRHIRHELYGGTLEMVTRMTMDWQRKGLAFVLQRRVPGRGFAYIVTRSERSVLRGYSERQLKEWTAAERALRGGVVT